MEKLVELVVAGGPTAIATILAVMLVYVNGERVKLSKQNAKLHNEKEEMYKEWHKESAARNERLHAALSNSTIATSTNAASLDSLKTALNGVSTGLQAIMQFMSGWIGGRPSK